MNSCKKCGGKFSNRVIIDEKERNLQNRKFCLECSPFGSHNTADLTEENRINGRIVKKVTCCLCHKDFLSISYRRRCGTCITKIRRYRIKKAAIAFLGGECVDCGETFEQSVFEFHHRDKNKKEFNISGFNNKSWQYVKEELLKCDLLCANCHRLRHIDYTEEFLEAVNNYKGNVLSW